MFDPAIVIPPIYYNEYIIPIVNTLKCAKKPSPKVIVLIKNKKIKYSTKKSSRQLEAFQIDTVSPYGADVHTRVSGLTEGKINVGIQSYIGSTASKLTGVGCLWYKTITVTIISDPTVYIASEHKNNRCRYNKTLKHELKHVSVDRRTVKEYASKIKYAVKKRAREVGTVGPKSRRSMKSANKKMLNELNSALQVVVQEMSRTRSRRQQIIDSKKEYDRLSKSCAGTF